MSLLAKQIGFWLQPNSEIRGQKTSLWFGKVLVIQNTLNSLDSVERRLERCTAYLPTQSLKPSINVLRRDLITSDERRSAKGASQLKQKQPLVSYNGCSRLTKGCLTKRTRDQHLTEVGLLDIDARKRMTRTSRIASSFEVHGGMDCSVPVPNGPLGPREIRSDGALTTVRTSAVYLVKRDEQKVMA